MSQQDVSDYAMPKKYYSTLTTWACLQIEGQGAIEFMQNQLAADIKQSNCCFSALCDIKGRVTASGYLLQHSEQSCEFWIDVSLIEIVLQQLQHYALFAALKIQHNKSRVAIIHNNSELSEFNKFQRNDYESEFIISLNSNDQASICETLQQNNSQIKLQTWVCHELQHRRCQITLATHNKFLPQMLEMEKRSGVSFNKGCFLGQEIIARTQHRGNLKRHLQQLTLALDNNIKNGTSLKNSAQDDAGLIINYCNCNQHSLILAVISDRFTQQNLKPL